MIESEIIEHNEFDNFPQKVQVVNTNNNLILIGHTYKLKSGDVAKVISINKNRVTYWVKGMSSGCKLPCPCIHTFINMVNWSNR
jgi:hypothetical protein